MNDKSKLELNMISKVNTTRFTKVVKDIKEINGLEIPNYSDERILEQLKTYYLREKQELENILKMLRNLKITKLKYKVLIESLNEMKQ